MLGEAIMHIPEWLNILALASLGMAGASALVIVVDLFTDHAQHMWIMNLVWPITALYLGPIALLAYFKWGRLATHHAMVQAKQQGRENPGKQKPLWATCAVATTHCGAGCTLGDIIAEWLMLAFPLVLFNHKIFGTWLIDYVCAFLLGIAFQYFTIKPMRDLPPGKALVMALKADTLSLTAWQIGMYGWMAIATFAIFGRELRKTAPLFWFMMQIAMVLGFLTSYPVNWWLLKKKIKEAM